MVKTRSALLSVLFGFSAAFTVNITRVPVSEPVTSLHHMLAQHRNQSSDRHHLQGGNFNIDLLNNANLAYTGPIFVGTPF